MSKTNSFVVATDVRLVQDAEARKAGEKDLVSFTYADNSGDEKDETMFVRVTVSGKLAEIMGNLKKGDRVNVVGKMSYNTYKKNDGSTGIGFKINYPMSVTRVYTDSSTTIQPAPAVEAPKRGRPPGKKAETVTMPWEDD
jgi:single-stranded DNA-binding protein